MSFILKGPQILAFQLKGWLKSKTSIQEYRNEIQNESYDTCFQYNVKSLESTI
jgi:hypothetical protein